MAKDNTLYLRRDKERKTDKHPEFRGSGMVFGREVWISAYVNDGQDREGQPEKYFKISVRPKQEDAPAPDQAPVQTPAQVATEDDFNDDIPF